MPDPDPREATASGEGSASDEPHAAETASEASARSRHQHCESCGRDDEPDVIEVHRVYVTPETWDTPGKVEVMDEVERWCFVCRTHYPHQVVGSEETEL